jgi:hypothetical protein
MRDERRTFVICVKDDFGVILERSRECLPERFEGGCVFYDFAIVAPIVVGIEHGVCTFTGNVVDGLDRSDSQCLTQPRFGLPRFLHSSGLGGIAYPMNRSFCLVLPAPS